MNAVAKTYHYSNDDKYFALENDPNNRDNGIRYEMIDGLIYAMSGGSLRHSQLAGNIYFLFRQYLKNKSCLVFSENVKVKIARSDYVYPDVVVDCTPEKAENNMLTTYYHC